MTTDLLSSHLSEAAIVQNESLGAFVLWKFGLAFQDPDGYPATLPLVFLILPLVLHGPTLSVVLATQKISGFHLFVGKLGEKREDLLAVHGRAMALRHLTLESLMLGERSGLFRIEPSGAKLWSNGLSEGLRVPILPERVRRIVPACERLGYWFSGVPDQQVVHSLRVEF